MKNEAWKQEYLDELYQTNGKKANLIRKGNRYAVVYDGEFDPFQSRMFKREVIEATERLKSRPSFGQTKILDTVPVHGLTVEKLIDILQQVSNKQLPVRISVIQPDCSLTLHKIIGADECSNEVRLEWE